MKVSTIQGNKPPQNSSGFIRGYDPFASLKYFPCPEYPYQWQLQDLEDHQMSGPDGEITTSFEYDGIQRLVRVTDTEDNVMTSTYDMGEI